MTVVAVVAISISLASTSDAKLSEVAYLPFDALVNFPINIRQTCLEKDLLLLLLLLLLHVIALSWKYMWCQKIQWFWCVTPCQFFSDVSVNVTHRHDVTARVKVIISRRCSWFPYKSTVDRTSSCFYRWSFLKFHFKNVHSEITLGLSPVCGVLIIQCPPIRWMVMKRSCSHSRGSRMWWWIK